MTKIGQGRRSVKNFGMHTILCFIGGAAEEVLMAKGMHDRTQESQIQGSLRTTDVCNCCRKWVWGRERDCWTTLKGSGKKSRPRKVNVTKSFQQGKGFDGTCNYCGRKRVEHKPLPKRELVQWTRNHTVFIVVKYQF